MNGKYVENREMVAEWSKKLLLLAIWWYRFQFLFFLYKAWVALVYQNYAELDPCVEEFGSILNFHVPLTILSCFPCRGSKYWRPNSFIIIKGPRLASPPLTAISHTFMQSIRYFRNIDSILFVPISYSLLWRNFAVLFTQYNTIINGWGKLKLHKTILKSCR